MIIGYFNARGPNNGIEHWFDLEIEELRKRGHNVKVFSLKYNHPTIEDIRSLDFAHFHFAQVAEAFKRINIPFAISPHANDIWIDNGANLISASKHPKCKFVTYQSFYHKRIFEEWGIEKPLVYLPMCVRTNLFKRKSSFLGNNIIAGGRLIPKKGLDRLSSVNDLIIFGDGPLKDYLTKKLPNAKFVGYLDGSSLKDLMENSWLFLHPGIQTPDGDRDGIPNTLKEAMLMELQVLASPISGIPELENINLLSDWSIINDVIDVIPKELNYKGRREILNTYSPESTMNRFLEAIETYS